MIIAKVQNKADGVEMVVSQIGAAKFSVVLHDTAADAYVDEIKIFGSLEKAMAYAGTINQAVS
jgi:hypothetical protein